MTEAYLGLGSNVGKREDYLQRAVDLINDFSATEIINISSIYETKPWGYTDQPDFLNLCVAVETELEPSELLSACQQVEKELERSRDIKWGPRTIDVDILIYGQLTLEEEDLILPHPRLTDRAFVLVPLVELNSSLVVAGKQVTDWLAEVDKTGVKKYSSGGKNS